MYQTQLTLSYGKTIVFFFYFNTGDQLPDRSSEFVTRRYAGRTQRHQFTERSEGTLCRNAAIFYVLAYLPNIG